MKIVIVGGGTAGWFTSLYLSKLRPQHTYTTIVSDEIGTIGIGEATTGKFTQMLAECGIDSLDFMLATDALPKHSIRFKNWTSKFDSFDSPLESSVSQTQFLDDRLFLQILNDKPIEYASVTGIFSLNEKTTYRLVDGQLQSLKPHALQFDESLVGKYFKSLAIDNGVNFINDTIVDVELQNNLISKLTTKSGNTITADLFIDCSGLKRLLIGKFNPEFVDLSKHINVNAATIFEVRGDTSKRNTVVNSIARECGWTFEIPSRHRIGRGYVHNNNIKSKNKILQELQNIYGTGVEETKTITWTPGYLKECWMGNVIAVGLASGLLEPLNAGTIHDAIMQVKDLVETGLLDNNCESSRRVYNRRQCRLFEDYLHLQCISYAGGRDDTEFWHFVKYDQQLTDRASEIIELAKHRLTRDLDFEKFMGYINHGYYNYALAGLGFFDKNIIKSVFAATNINVDLLNKQQQEFEDFWLKETLLCLSPEELNDKLKELT